MLQFNKCYVGNAIHRRLYCVVLSLVHPQCCKGYQTHKSLYSSTAHRKRLSDVNVSGDPRSSSFVFQLHGRRSGGSHSTTSPTASSLASRTAKRRIPIDNVASGVDSQLHGRRSGESHSTTSQLHVGSSTTTNFWPATWPTNALSVYQNRLTCHVLRRTAFIAAQSRGRPYRFHCSSIQVTYANTRCGSHLAAACGQVS